MKKYTTVLTIAGSDSSGGAGIQADLKTISAMGCYGMSAITALTAQNTCGVSEIHNVPPKFVSQQINTIMEDIDVDAIKIGMLATKEIIFEVANCLKSHKIEKLVVDPVMVSTSGSKLISTDAIDTLKSELLPMATIVTPNLFEVATLLKQETDTYLNCNYETLQQASVELSDFCGEGILIKGGHNVQKDWSNDMLYLKNNQEYTTFKSKRIETENTHGTGCTLSSAIACGLAKGFSIVDSIFRAKDYINDALEAGSNYLLGKGHGPVHHFYKLWQ